MAYKLTDKTIYGGAIALIGSAIVIGGSITFTEEYGLWAPAVAMLSCFVVMSLLAWLVSQKYFPVAYPWARILGYVTLVVLATYVGADAGSMWVRGALFAALLLAFWLMERNWIKRTFLR